MSTSLLIQNTYSWLNTDDIKLKSSLWNALRFLDRNYYHSAAYKRGFWDGYKEFFNKNSGMFLTGLLPEVLAALKIKKVQYQVVDERNSIRWQFTEIDKHFLNNQGVPEGLNPEHSILYDYQVDFVNQAIKYNRGIIKAPTGAGKSLLALSIIKCLPPKTSVLFMTKNSGLVDQTYQELKLWGVPDLGRYYGTKHKELNRIMCITSHIKTFESIKKLLPLFQVLMVDEVHECMSDVPIKAYKSLKNASVRFGISATPFKFTKQNAKGKEDCKDKVHKHSVKGYFGAVFKTRTTESGSLTTQDLQERGILSKSRCTFYPITEPTNIRHEPYLDAVTLGISNNFKFLQTVQRLAQSLNGRTLILVERIDQGEYLQQLLPGSIWIQGKDDIDKRAAAFKELKFSGKVIAIAMRHIITAGINIFCHNLINAAGGKAEHSVVQQLGRGLRCANDKELLNFYDFIYKTNDYLYKHSQARLEIIANEGHKIVIKEDIDF